MDNQYGTEGHDPFDSRGATLEVPARSPFVLSLADQMASERGPDERLQLYLARDSFRELAPVLDAVAGAVVTGPLRTMLAEYLEFLCRNLGQINPADAARLKSAVGSMIAACVSPSSDRLAAAESQLNLGRLERVRRVVRQELRSPLLEPAMLSRRIGVSRSALYRLMESKGGVTRYIRRLRLLESRAVLSDPGCEKSIAAIAEEFCFSDAADFSRSFRREFGLTPSDVRATAHVEFLSSSPANACVEGGDLTFNDFIQAL